MSRFLKTHLMRRRYMAEDFGIILWDTFRKAAKWNKITLDEQVMKNVREEVSVRRDAWREVTRSRTMLGRLALLACCRAAAGLAAGAGAGFTAVAGELLPCSYKHLAFIRKRR